MGSFRKELGKALGTVIRRHRVRRSLTQVALASESEVTQPTISATETGETLPDYEVLERIARALGVRMSELFREAETLYAPAEIHTRLAELDEEWVANEQDEERKGAKNSAVAFSG